jgi:hypothetical protein
MSTAEEPQTQYADMGVHPALPLSLLEAVKAHDRPSEILEDEDLTTSLPRRLGLTGVVENQIAKYQDARRRGRGVSLPETLSLFRLVLRRPDAEAILRETGQRVARGSFARLPAFVAKLLRFLPRKMVFAAARKAAIADLKRAAYPGQVEMAGRPFVVRITGAPPSELEPAGVACVMYAAIMEESVGLYTGRRHEARHSRCSSQGEKWCEWKLSD